MSPVASPAGELPLLPFPWRLAIDLCLGWRALAFRTPAATGCAREQERGCPWGQMAAGSDKHFHTPARVPVASKQKMHPHADEAGSGCCITAPCIQGLLATRSRARLSLRRACSSSQPWKIQGTSGFYTRLPRQIHPQASAAPQHRLLRPWSTPQALKEDKRARTGFSPSLPHHGRGHRNESMNSC